MRLTKDVVFYVCLGILAFTVGQLISGALAIEPAEEPPKKFESPLGGDMGIPPTAAWNCERGAVVAPDGEVYAIWIIVYQDRAWDYPVSVKIPSVLANRGRGCEDE